MPRQDLQTRAKGRLLHQFQNSPVLLAALQALVSEVQACSDALTALDQGSTPADAVGVHLDAIGRIVGQSRDIIGFKTINYFSWDTPGKGFDAVPWAVEGAPTFSSGTTAEADDNFYRLLIQAKVFRNSCKYGSLTEVQEMAREAFGLNVSFMPADTPKIPYFSWDTPGKGWDAVPWYVENASIGGSLGDLVMIYAVGAPEYFITFMSVPINTNSADCIYYPPYPAGTRIVDTICISDL